MTCLSSYHLDVYGYLHISQHRRSFPTCGGIALIVSDSHCFNNFSLSDSWYILHIMSLGWSVIRGYGYTCNTFNFFMHACCTWVTSVLPDCVGKSETNRYSSTLRVERDHRTTTSSRGSKGLTLSYSVIPTAIVGCCFLYGDKRLTPLSASTVGNTETRTYQLTLLLEQYCHLHKAINSSCI